MVGILALGIGATTAAFTLISSVLLQPLGYSEAGRLVQLWSAVPQFGSAEVWGLSKGQYLHFRENARTLESVGLYSISAASLGAGGAGNEFAEQIQVAAVDDGVPRALRIQPQVGRTFTKEESAAGVQDVVVLTHRFWTERYGADPGVLGRRIPLDGRYAEVVGVLSPAAKLPEEIEVPHIIRIDLWTPVRLDPAEVAASTGHQMRVVARLRDEATSAAAGAEIAGLTAQLPDVAPRTYSPEFMRTSGFSTRVVPLHASIVADTQPLLWLLFAIVLLVLVIACANVVSLLLARFEMRRPEAAIRSALGASRFHLARDFFVEGMVLAVSAAAIGLVVAWGLVRLVIASSLPIPRLNEVRFGWQGVAFAVAVAVAISLIAGLLPLLQRGHTRAIAEAGRGQSASKRSRRARSVLAAGQVAVTFVLVVAGALLFMGFRKMAHVDPGFRAEGVLTFRVVLPPARYESFESAAGFYREVAARLEGLASVETAGVASALPLSGYNGCSNVDVEHRAARADEPPLCLPTYLTGPEYFSALRIPVTGETPRWDDLAAGGVVVSQAFAERIWPGEGPIGKRVRVGGDGEYIPVIGVSGDVRSSGLGRPAPAELFFPLTEAAARPLGGAPHTLAFVLRSSSHDPAALLPSIQRLIRDIDPYVPVTETRTMEQVVRQSTRSVSFMATLLAIASGIALALSAVGIYGIISYLVVQRRGEIGIRLALGATTREIAWMVVRQSLRVAGAGVVAGVLGSVLVTQLLRSVLVGIGPWEPVVLLGASILLLAAAAAASFIPARQSTRIPPSEALRAQ